MRFSDIKIGYLYNVIFYNLLSLGIKDLLFDVQQDERIKLLKIMYQNECVNKAVNLAYNILRLKKTAEDKEKIMCIEKEIKEIIKNIPYTLEQKHIDNGIKNILDTISNQ